MVYLEGVPSDMSATVGRAGSKLAKSYFVYLLVRPYCDSSNTCDLCIDTVLGGVGLSAKIKAKNESLLKSSRLMICSAPPLKPWRILMGFYAHKSNWSRKIKNHWTLQCDWEVALVRGVRFAVQFSVNKTLYLSSEARSKPRSVLLLGLQSLCVSKNPEHKKKIMEKVMSNKTPREILSQLDTLTPFWTGADLISDNERLITVCL